ncbi:carph-isopro domain-containing protein [Sphingomonas sp. CFBP 8764]|uniref:carph-isopro domain-containing protein n=1 Tax=Sphingomonas sp. CFBP 8764 TaxID=2775275 RepID=UPI00406C10FB
MAQEVILALGGITRLSRHLGHRHPSTVQGWWERNVIPVRQQRRILELAQERGISIEPIDLIAGADR